METNTVYTVDCCLDEKLPQLQDVRDVRDLRSIVSGGVQTSETSSRFSTPGTHKRSSHFCFLCVPNFVCVGEMGEEGREGGGEKAEGVA